MFITQLDLLYMQPQVDNLCYVLDGSKLKNPQTIWSPGFRIDLGYRFQRDAWQVDLSWMCLPTNKEIETQGHLLPVWSSAPQTPDSFVDRSKVRWRLHLGIVDLLLSKTWVVSRRLHLQPGMGLRFASLRQKFFVSYFGGNLFPGVEDTLHTKNKFWGLGPVVSFNTRWLLSPRWSFLGRFNYSLVRSQFYEHEKEWEVETHRTHFRLFNTTENNSALYQLAFGLEWLFNQCRFHVMWEEDFFPHQNHLQYPLPSTQLLRGGNLSVAGLSAGVLWQF